MTQADRLARNLSLEERIEQGKFFGTSPILSVDSITNSLVSVTTGPTVKTHAYISFISAGASLVNVYLSPTVTVPGTPQPVANFNIGHPNTPTIDIRLAPTVSANGLKIADFLIPGGSGGNAVGGAVASSAKVVLPPSTAFLFEFDNTSGGGTIPIEFTINFYEVGA